MSVNGAGTSETLLRGFRGRSPLIMFLDSKEYLDWFNDTGKTLFYSEFIEIQAWLLLTFFLCLDNQLISIYYFVI